MRDELLRLVQSLDKRAYVINIKRTIYKCLFNTVIYGAIIDAINNFCNKYNCRWSLLTTGDSFGLTIIKK